MTVRARRIAVRLVCAAVLAAGPARADDTSDDERAAAVRAATNPLPYVEEVKFIPSYTFSQPFLAVHPCTGLAVSSDAQMSFYWRGGSTTIPVNLGLGYAFSKHFVGTIKGTLTVAGNDDDTWKAEVDLGFLP